MTLSDLPDWPAMMDLPTALAYLCLKEDAFRSLLARGGVRPVDLGNASVRWRRRDLDALIDNLPVRAAKSPGDDPRDSRPPFSVIAAGDPALDALAAARRRASR